jgi:lipopolysaccharide/colanic/teichoic acid biosynthesis glycosyltransferase
MVTRSERHTSGAREVFRKTEPDGQKTARRPIALRKWYESDGENAFSYKRFEGQGTAISSPAPFQRSCSSCSSQRSSCNRPSKMRAQNTPTHQVNRTPFRSLYAKHAVDFLTAVLLLILIAPLWLAVALTIKLTSRGPVLFTQTRVGRWGALFTLYKFRTMVGDNSHDRAALRGANLLDGPAFKMAQDPRVTTVGRFLRRYSLDELPQLLNVLQGKMSLVGPRPHLPEEFTLYQDDPTSRERLAVRPGITGLWQVSGRAEIREFSRWLEIDHEYVTRLSPLRDLKILVKTIPAVLSGRGAY